MKIPSIVKGNDFTIKVYVYKPTYIDENTTLTDFDLHNCSSINVFLVNGADSYAVEYTIDEMEPNLLKVTVDYLLPVGSYGIEITGKDSNNHNWRFKAKKGEFMNIIDATSGSDFNNDLLEDGLYVTARVGILSMNMENYYTKDELDSRLANIDALVNDTEIVRRHELSNYATASQLNEETTIYNESSSSPSESQSFSYTGLNGNYYFDVPVQTIDVTRTSNIVPIYYHNIDTIINAEYNTYWPTFNNLCLQPTGIIDEYAQPVEIIFDFSLSRGYFTAYFYNHSWDYHEYEYNNNTLGAEILPPSHALSFNGFDTDGKCLIRWNPYESELNHLTINPNGTELHIYDTGQNMQGDNYVRLYVYGEDGSEIYIDFDNQNVNAINPNVYVTSTFYGNSVNIVLSRTFTTLTVSTGENYIDISGQGAYTSSGTTTRVKDAVIGIMNDLAYNYPTNSDIANAGYLTSHQDISHLALRSELFSGDYNDLTNKPDIPTVPTNLSEFVNDVSYVTQSELDAMGYLQSHQSLDNYYTKDDIDNAGYLTSHQSLDAYPTKQEIVEASYVTSSALSSMAYLQEHQSLDNYYTKSDIDNASYVTQSALSEMSYLQQHQSLDDYYTKSEIDNAGYLQSHQSLENYYTKSDIENASYVSKAELSSMSYLQQHQSLDDYYTKSEINNAGYLQQHQSLDDYYTKSEINNAGYLQSHQSLSGYATEQWVNDKFEDMLGINAEGVTSLANILSDEDNTTGILTEISRKANSSDVYSKSEINSMGYLQSHQSLDGYYTKEEINNAGYLQSHQSLDNYYTKSDIQSMSYVSQDILSSMSYLTSHQSLDGYYTKEEINNAGYLQSHQSLDNYYTKNEINNAGYLTSHQSLDAYPTKQEIVEASYVTNTALSEMGYLQQHQSLDNYYTKSDIQGMSYVSQSELSQMGYLQNHQSLDGYYTKEEINNAGYLQSHQSLADYVTKSDLDNAGYLTSHQSLDNYVTKNDLSNAGYLTSIPNTYVTKQQLDECTYINISGTITESGTYSINNISEFELDVQFIEDQALEITFYANNEYSNSVHLYIYSGYSGNPLTDEYFEVNYSLIEDYEKEEGDWWSKYRITCNYPVKSVIVDDGNYDINYSLTYGKSCTVIDNFDYYVSKTDLNNASYVTQTSLSNMGYLTSHQSLSNYYTKTEINNAGYLTSHQSLDNYVTKSDLDNAGYLTSHQDISNLALKSELFSGDYNDLINKPTIPTVPTNLSGFVNDVSYVTQTELSNMGYLQSHQSLSNYYTKTEINNAGYLTSHQSLDNYATKSDLISYLSVDNLNTANTKMQFRTNGLTVVTTNNTIAPKVLTYAQFNNENNPWVGGTTLKNYVDGRLAEIEASYITSHQSLDNYYSKSDIDNASYITATELSNCGYLQSHQSLSDYYTKTEINNAGYLTSHQSLSDYATISYVTENYLTSSGDLSSINFVSTGAWIKLNGNNKLGIFSSNIRTHYNNSLNLGTSTSAWKTAYSYNYYTYNDGWQGLNETLEKTITSSTSGLKIEIVASMPANPDVNTIYIVQ